MSRWLREPLLHFLLIGGAVFLAYAWFGEGGDKDEIVISRGQQENLLQTFARTWQRPPTADEFRGLLEDHVRQEIAYREGLAMGLDEDDIVIRRRLRQKLELLAEDVAALDAPTEAQLRSYLDAHRENFRIEPRLTLRQIYFSRDRRGEDTRQDALTLLERIRTDGPDGGLEDFGDPLALPGRLQDMRVSELGRMFGESFAAGLEGLEAGRWAGPVESGYGLHLVFVERREGGRDPELAEVREAVQREWFEQRRREAVAALYERLAEEYTVRFEPLEGTEAGATEAGATETGAGDPAGGR